MNETELASIVQRRVDDSLGTFGDQLSADRVDALKRYRGDAYGDEVEGRSKVVTHDVAEAVDSLMPPLLKVFLAGDKVVMFEPTGAEDEEVADQATDYCNHIFLQQNDGFKTVYTTLKDGLLFKTGVAKVWWDDTPETTQQRYVGLSEEQVMMLQQDGDIEVEIEEDEGYEPGIGINVTVTQTNKKGKCCVAPVPPEEFLIDRYATKIDQSEPDGPLFTGHRQLRIVSDVVAEFPDKAEVIKSLAGIGGDADYSGEKRERWNDESPGQIPEHDENDDSTRPVWVTEAYIRVDYDEDGVAELRKVTCVGETGYEVLDNVEVDDNPFAAWSPVLMPHKFHGMSIADQIVDLQKIKTTLLRGMLNNMYFTNEPMTKVSRRGNVDLDQLLNRRVGGVVEMDDITAVEEMTVPPMFQAGFPMLEYIDKLKADRTGVTQYTQGLDADALNKTARGITLIQDAAQQRQELVARVYAEIFMKRLFALILKCVAKYQAQPRMIRLRNKWVPMDPRTWKNKYDMTVMVGLGTGNREQQAAHAMNVLNIQKEIILAPGGEAMVSPQNIYNTLEKLISAIGWKATEAFFTDPSNAPPAPPQPPPIDPRVVEVQSKAELQAQKDRMDHQYRMDQAAKQHELDLYKAQLKALIDGWTAEQAADRDLAKAIDEIDIKRTMSDSDAELKMDRHKFEQALASEKAKQEPEKAEGSVANIAVNLSDSMARMADAVGSVVERVKDVESTMTAPKTISVQRVNGKITGGKVTQNGKTSEVKLSE